MSIDLLGNCSYTGSSGTRPILMDDKAKLEYIWLDGYEPTQNMRSKTMVRSDFTGTLEECPIWMFDGSSTRQADGSASDCLLKPVAIFPTPHVSTVTS